MLRTACTVGRGISRTFFCALLVAGPAYAGDAFVAADFDGDGHGDRVTVTTEQPTVVRVWLSSTTTTELLRSAEPIVRLATADLDGDHRPEIIVSDGSSLLRIWTKPHRHFHRFRAKAPQRPSGLSGSAGRASAARTELPSPTTLAARPLASSLTSGAYLGSPVATAWSRAPHASAVASSALSTLLAPRPPPFRFAASIYLLVPASALSAAARGSVSL